MIHQERRKAMEAMEEAMNVQQQMRRYESKYINQSFIACYEKGVMKIVIFMKGTKLFLYFYSNLFSQK